MPAIEFSAIAKTFGSSAVIRDLSFALNRGETLWLSGPSGSGKTTILRLIAGLEVPDRGCVLLDDAVASGPGVYLPPAYRRIGMVFQDFALWPHKTVEGHLDFVLKAKGISRADRRARIAELLALCGLQDRVQSRPAQLSGGEQQRLSIFRALASEPRILLLDEPTAHLDIPLKERMFREFFRRKRSDNLTIVIAAHGGDEIRSETDQVLVIGEAISHPFPL